MLTALAKLTKYFEPKKNIPFERRLFRQAAQGPTENMDSYVTRLRSLAKSCAYASYAYGSKTPLPVKGILNANVSTSQLQTQADFVVVENLHAGSLLGKKNGNRPWFA